jgi:hypothetical protein
VGFLTFHSPIGLQGLLQGCFTFYFVVTDFTEEDMSLHEQWYQWYEILKTKQKQAIQKWRTLKNEISQENCRNSEPIELNIRSKVEDLKDSVETKQKIGEWKVLYLTLFFLKEHLELCIFSEC